MAYRKYYRKRKYVRRARKPSKKTKTGNKLATRGYVKRVMHKAIENKFFTAYSLAQQVYVQSNSAPAVGAGLIDLIPAISQGNTSSTRIGNRIKVVKSTLDMSINMNPYSATSNPYVPGVWVKMWIIKLRTSNITTGPTLSEFQQFFQNNSSNAAFQGNELDLNFKVCAELFEVYSQKLIWLSNSSSSANGIPNASSYQFSTGKNSHRCSFNLTKHLNNLVYNDAITNAATNKNLWCVIQPVYSQYNAGSGNLYNPINITYAQNTFYEDA